MSLISGFAHSVENAKELEALEQLRERLARKEILEEKKLHNDKFLLRYLKNVKLNVDKAEKIFECYVRCLKETNVDALLKTPSPPEFPRNFEVLFGGVDYENRPLLQVPRAWKCNLKETVEAGKYKILEQLLLKIHWTAERIVAANNVDFSVLIVDMKDVSYLQFLHKKSFGAIIDFISKVEEYSPNLVKRVILVNGPRTVRLLLAAARKLITIPAEVIVVGEGEKNWRDKLKEYAPENQLLPEFGGSLTSYYSVS